MPVNADTNDERLTCTYQIIIDRALRSTQTGLRGSEIDHQYDINLLNLRQEPEVQEPTNRVDSRHAEQRHIVQTGHEQT